MKRNFAFPVIVAAAAHGALVLATRGPSGVATPPEVRHTSVWIAEGPPPVETEVGGMDRPGPAAGGTRPPPVRIPDAPHPRMGPGSFWQQVGEPPGIVPPNPGAERIRVFGTEGVGGQGTGGGPVPVFSLDHQPSARLRMSPEYPRDLRASGQEGEATVLFSVDTSGRVYDAVVVRADHGAFAEEALRAIRRWRFEPGIKDNRPVPFRMAQTFTFTLGR